MIINHLKTETMTQTVLPHGLVERIQDVIDGENSTGLPWIQCSPNDSYAIGRNIMRHHAEHEITDVVIESEVDLFYNA